MTEPYRGSTAPDVGELEREWIGQHLDDLRPWLDEGRLLRRSLVIALILGLIAHVIGYALRAMNLAEPLGFVADIVYSLGFALWTGGVVAYFVDVFPETKRRQLKQLLEAYDAKAATSAMNR